ncbi:sensor histidine kinase [Streptomyces sp. CBMA152]|uniref:sensor histidine kinase n=1 Tax=Streptomyces sp. CBMA152 TaxID=1896312 RepID=UPI00166064BE|nr:histidine kinase [Streptomyces sp. CBMA152]MBD0744493.1 histidine kinase [Streptomyces sp. CBMA152]
MTIPFLTERPTGLRPATSADYALMTLMVLPLVWRRRAPVTVMLAVLTAGSLYKLTLDGPGQPLPYSGLIALYTVAALSPVRQRLGMAALTAALIAPSVALNTQDTREMLFSFFVFGAAYALGRLTHTRQAYTAAVEDRAAQLERANRIEAEQAAARERARIAREMHDILSHAVSIMIVQAEAGPLAVRAAPERAEAAFDAISETGRDAMVQLRRMLGVLREAPESPRRPQPGLAELPELIGRVASGGPSVTYETTGEPRALPPDLETTLYRITQEALTNAVKHARADAISVQLAYDDGELALTVTDDGRGPGAASGPGTGHGLIGISERAAAHGGTAWSGAGPDGGFQVRARLPHTATNTRKTAALLMKTEV